MPPRSPSSGRRAGRSSKDASATLQAFLEHPSRPPGTLTYHELQGFLFAVLSAPELIRPSEWLPLVFNEEPPGFSTADEANAVLAEIMGLYNEISAAVLDERVVLPADCEVLPRALDNLEDASPLARWSRGFLTGHEWLEELWNVDLAADLDEEVGAVLMTLSFFSSRRLADAFYQETAGPNNSLEAFAESILRLIPDALGEYAHFGRVVLGAVSKSPTPPSTPSPIGRNDPCPCGSGKKFKKCCGLARH